VFHDPDYPGACSYTTLTRLIPGEFQVVGAADLVTSLQAECTILISFHGPYFPKDAWNALLRFFETGGNLAIFGGMPFTHPIDADGTIEPEQQAYTDQLSLGPFFPLDVPGADVHLRAADTAVFLENCPLDLPAKQPGKFWSFYPKLTQVSDYPEDGGTAGPLDTLLTPLLFAGTDEQAQPLATPAVLLDQQYGRFAGGRWLLSPWQPSSEDDWWAIAPAIQRLLLLAAEGPAILDARPQLACYQPGEVPTFTISSRSRSAIHARAIVHTPQNVVLDSF
jgi:hypothetical protein